MELKIFTPEDQFPKQIKWNYADLKREITEAAKDYAEAVYTDDSIKAAKADRAKLNTFVKAIEKKRTDIRRQLLAPDELFGKEIKELTGIVNKAIDNIDGQVKGYEERQRQEKTGKVREFYEENINDLAEYLPFEQVFQLHYANASTTMKSIKEEILAAIQNVAEGIAILNEVDSPYAGDMKAVFLRTYDLGLALAERNRLEAEAARRAEYEAHRAAEKAERETRMKAETAQVVKAGKESKKEEPAKTVQPQTPVRSQNDSGNNDFVLDFRVHVSLEQLNALKQFLKDTGIDFERVPVDQEGRIIKWQSRIA